MKSTLALLTISSLALALACGCSSSEGTTPNCTDYPCSTPAPDASPDDAADASDSSSQDANVAD